MKIGVISDTHDQRENTLKAVKIFNKRIPQPKKQ